jgi:thiol peroxidase
MKETDNTVLMRGNPLTLVGSALKVGDSAPDFMVVDNDMKPISLKDFAGKALIISSVPSLDTPVCDMETRRFNTEASNLDAGMRILTISMDLPFAQKRWCGAAGVDQVVTLSDHRQASFGEAFGVLIKELRLLARAVFVLDAGHIIRYIQLVREISEEPDYEAVLAAAKNIV